MKRQTAILRKLTRLTLRQVNILNPMVLALSQGELATLAGSVFVGFAQGNEQPVDFQAMCLNNDEEGVNESGMNLGETTCGIEAR